MKKYLSYLILTAIFLASNTGLVKAGNAALTGEGELNPSIVVGHVDTPVYDVDISWENFIFDWKYDYNTGHFNWVNPTECQATTYGELVEIFGNDIPERIYADQACTELAVLNSGYADSDVLYYQPSGTGEATITVTDSSTAGYVDLALDWHPADAYDFTTLTLKSRHNVGSCQTISAENLGDDEAYIDSNCSGSKYTVAQAPQGSTFYVKGTAIEEEVLWEDVGGPEMGYPLLPVSRNHATIGGASNLAGNQTREYNLIIELDAPYYETGEYVDPWVKPTVVPGSSIGTVTIVISTDSTPVI